MLKRQRTAVHHYGYIVADLEAAINRAVATLGTGPFLVLENVALENLRSRGEPAEYRHDTAFAQWGDIRLELTQIHDCGPARVQDAFRVSSCQLGHVAWTVNCLESASRQLEADGAPNFFSGSFGEISFAFHDARAHWGHHIELHRDTPAFHELFDRVHALSVNWDGREPIHMA